MYHAKIWDEDKLNFNSGSYSGKKYGSIFSEDKKEEKKYHEQKYGSDEKSASGDYMKKEDLKEKDDKKKDDLWDSLEEGKKDKEIKDEEITFRAAKQVFSESMADKKIEGKKDISSIEDAIKKAIEEEKKVILMDS